MKYETKHWDKLDPDITMGQVAWLTNPHNPKAVKMLKAINESLRLWLRSMSGLCLWRIGGISVVARRLVLIQNAQSMPDKIMKIRNKEHRHPLKRSSKYDAFYCPTCCVWTEPRCGAVGCEFCEHRPDTPAELIS